LEAWEIEKCSSAWDPCIITGTIIHHTTVAAGMEWRGAVVSLTRISTRTGTGGVEIGGETGSTRKREGTEEASKTRGNEVVVTTIVKTATVVAERGGNLTWNATGMGVGLGLLEDSLLTRMKAGPAVVTGTFIALATSVMTDTALQGWLVALKQTRYTFRISQIASLRRASPPCSVRRQMSRWTGRLVLQW
jgi:hypothetical protein